MVCSTSCRDYRTCSTCGWRISAIRIALSPSRRVRQLTLAVIAALLGCRPRADQSSQDPTLFRVVPGQQFGAIAPTTSHADLVRVFGAGNVHRSRVQCAEGSCDEPGTTVVVPEIGR